MNIKDFNFYQDLLRDECGLYIDEDKTFILISRLTPVAKKHGFANLDALTLHLRGFPQKQLLADVVNALCEYKSSFFHEEALFETLKTTLHPELLSQKKQINILFAGCGTGQEVYSLNILAAEHTLKIDACDISEAALKKAKEALYTQAEVQDGMPIDLLLAHFKKEDDQWRVKKPFRENIRFFPLNLSRELEALGTYDLMICREVLSAFDEEIISGVLARLKPHLSSHGYLVCGTKEKVIRAAGLFSPHETLAGVYRPVS